jgi:hypothetical protein
MFGELRLVRALTDEQIAAMRDPRLAGTVKLPRIEDAVKAGGFLAGRPADIIEQLKAVERRYPGLDRVICATPLGTPLDVQLEDLDRLKGSSNGRSWHHHPCVGAALARRQSDERAQGGLRRLRAVAPCWPVGRADDENRVTISL